MRSGTGLHVSLLEKALVKRQGGIYLRQRNCRRITTRRHIDNDRKNAGLVHPLFLEQLEHPLLLEENRSTGLRIGSNSSLPPPNPPHDMDPTETPLECRLIMPPSIDEGLQGHLSQSPSGKQP